MSDGSTILVLTILAAAILDVSARAGAYGLAPWMGPATATLSGALLLGVALAWGALAVRRRAEPVGEPSPGEGGRYGRSAILLVAVLWGVLERAHHFSRIPLTPRVADMLPLVDAALTRFLSGSSPYATYHMPWPLPLTYLPLTWLAYLPARLLGVDLRWTNAAAHLAILGALVFVSHRRSRGAVQSVGTVPVVAWAAFFVLPSVIHWDTITTAPVGWAAFAWTVGLLALEHDAAPVALGAALATTPLALLLLPLAALSWWNPQVPSEAVRRLIRTLAVAAAVLMPFVFRAPRAFLEGTVLWFNTLEGFPRLKWETARSWADSVGFSGWFWGHGLERWLVAVQGAVILGTTAAFKMSGRAPRSVPLFAAALLLAFVLFNPVLWPYLHYVAIVCALVALARAPDGSLKSRLPP